MIFPDITDGSLVFLDANTFIYAISREPQHFQACRDLIARVENGALSASTSTHILSDVAHRLMTIEAVKTFGWSYAGILRQLKRHPAEIQRLALFRQAIDDIIALGVHILSAQPHNIVQAAKISQQYGLLSNDALVVALMQQHGLTQVASNDADFDRVPGLIRYAPA
jgi:predicted nucleic acid-binding protein